MTAAYLRFDSQGESDATGTLNFVVGVDERGVALSPDTLVLPASVDSLPPSVVSAAMRVVGQAWGVANAGTLPSGVLAIARQTVDDKALLLAEAGLRNTFGQPLNDAIRDLAFDFYGGNPVDAGFDQLLRQTDAGHELALALGEALAPSAEQAGGVIEYERTLAQLAASGPDFISFAAQVIAGSPDIRLDDGLGRTLTASASSVPGGVVMPFGDAALVGVVWGAVIFLRGGLLAGALTVLLAGICCGYPALYVSAGPVPLTTAL